MSELDELLMTCLEFHFSSCPTNMHPISHFINPSQWLRARGARGNAGRPDRAAEVMHQTLL